MRDYISEKVDRMPRHFNFGGISVEEEDPIPDHVNIAAILRSVEDNFPSHYFRNLESVKIGHREEFDLRDVNAVYRDNNFYITNRQDNSQDLMDDIVHEFAHHLETLYTELIYGDESVKREFLRKRHELNFELRSEGYWTKDYDFEDLKFDENFDQFLYKRVGRNMLRLITTGLYIRPYAAVSLREYFATGFEAYYLGKQDALEKISPMLYDKINELHHYSEY